VAIRRPGRPKSTTRTTSQGSGRKPATQSQQTQTAPTRRSRPTRSRRFLVAVGSLWILIGVLLLAYLGYGLALYLNGWTGNFTRSLTALFTYPATSVLVPGYLPHFLLSTLMTLLLVLSIGALAYLVASRQWRRLAPLTVAVFLLVASVAALVGSVSGIDRSVIGYHSYLERFRALNQFQDKRKAMSPEAAQGQSSLPADEVKAQAVQQLLLANVIQQEAEKAGVEVSKKEVNEAYKQYAERNQGEDNLKKQLKDFLGWKPADFKKEIKTKLLEEKLNNKLSSDEEANKEPRKKAEGFLSDVKGGKDFAEVAKGSDDPTAKSGGAQGFVKRGETDPQIEEQAFKLEVGQVSEIIKTQRGYVIIKVAEKQPDQVNFSQILVRTQSLSDFIPEELKKAKVSVYAKGLVWDAAMSAIQPTNKQPQPELPPGAVPGGAGGQPGAQQQPGAQPGGQQAPAQQGAPAGGPPPQQGGAPPAQDPAAGQAPAGQPGAAPAQ